MFFIDKYEVQQNEATPSKNQVISLITNIVVAREDLESVATSFNSLLLVLNEDGSAYFLYICCPHI